MAALVIPPRRHCAWCLFRLALDASIDARGVRASLGHLLEAFRTPVTIICDRSDTHCGKIVQRWLSTHLRVRVEILPP